MTRTRKIFDSTSIPWRSFEHNTNNVFVKDLSNKEFSEHFNISLFRVERDGEFPIHNHSHSYIMHFLSGTGELLVEQRLTNAKPGLVAKIESNEDHGYRNTGRDDLILIVLNTPATR